MCAYIDYHSAKPQTIDFRIPKFQYSRISGFQGSRIPGFQNYEIP